MGKAGEKVDLTREEKEAERDYQRLVATAGQQEGKERYWEQEAARLGGMVSRARRRSTQQDNLVRDVKVTWEKARKALELAEREARRCKEEVQEVERSLGRSKEALEKARVDAEVRLMNNTGACRNPNGIIF